MSLSIFALAASLLVSCTREPPPFEEEKAKAKADRLIAEENRRINSLAPEFSDSLEWINSKPVTMRSLRGKAVFIRFWRSECEMCQQSVPTLNYLDKTYKQKGLVIIGLHIEYKNDPKVNRRIVEKTMKLWHIDFPVAIDRQGATVSRYLLPDSDYASASVLIDRRGRLQWIHPGGVLCAPPAPGFYPTEPAFESLRTNIEAALKE